MINIYFKYGPRLRSVKIFSILIMYISNINLSMIFNGLVNEDQF